MSTSNKEYYMFINLKRNKRNGFKIEKLAFTGMKIEAWYRYVTKQLLYVMQFYKNSLAEISGSQVRLIFFGLSPHKFGANPARGFL